MTLEDMSESTVVAVDEPQVSAAEIPSTWVPIQVPPPMCRQERRRLEREALKNATRAVPMDRTRILDPEFIQQATRALGGVAGQTAPSAQDILSNLGGLASGLGQAASNVAAASGTGSNDPVPERVVNQVFDELLASLGGVSGKTKVQVDQLEKHLKGRVDAETFRKIKTAIGPGKHVMQVRDLKKALSAALLA